MCFDRVMLKEKAEWAPGSIPVLRDSRVHILWIVNRASLVSGVCRQSALPSDGALLHKARASGKVLRNFLLYSSQAQTVTSLLPRRRLQLRQNMGIITSGHMTWPEGRNSWVERGCAQIIGETCREEQQDIAMTVVGPVDTMQREQWILRVLILHLDPCYGIKGWDSFMDFPFVGNVLTFVGIGHG